VGENVYGLVNWSRGLVFHEVQADLEAQGYEVFPYVLAAAAVNAPHRRDRVFFIAHSKHIGSKSTRESGNIFEKKGKARKERSQFAISIENGNGNEITANTDNNGFNKCDSGNEVESSKTGINALGNIDESNGNGDASDSNGIGLRRESDRIGESGFVSKNESGNYWQTFPTVSPVCDGDDGISDRLDSITFSKWRKESIKAGGNAIVPQVALQIFKAIQEYENKIGPEDPAQDKRLV
jgi:DNA (cytosine-5)-methyltransferase 1